MIGDDGDREKKRQTDRRHEKHGNQQRFTVTINQTDGYMYTVG